MARSAPRRGDCLITERGGARDNLDTDDRCEVAPPQWLILDMTCFSVITCLIDAEVTSEFISDRKVRITSMDGYTTSGEFESPIS